MIEGEDGAKVAVHVPVDGSGDVLDGGVLLLGVIGGHPPGVPPLGGGELQEAAPIAREVLWKGWMRLDILLMLSPFF